MQTKRLDVSVLLLIVGVCIAIIAGFLIMKGQEYYNKLVPVVYCGAKDIPIHTIIKESDVVIIKVPKIVIQNQNIFMRKEDIIGKLSNTMIPSNTLVVKKQVIDLKTNSNLLASNLTLLNNPNAVAYTIPTTPGYCVGGRIAVNDTVHIIATMKMPVADGQPEKFVSKIIVPYAKVLEVITSTQSKEQVLSGVTFALTSQQALDVEFAMKKGTISFALLPYNYNIDQKDIATTEKSFIDRYLNDKGE